MAGPWEKYGQPMAPQMQRADDPIIAPPDPYKQAAEQRAQQDQGFDAQRLGMEAERLRIAQQEAAARAAKEAADTQERQSTLQAQETGIEDTKAQIRRVIDAAAEAKKLSDKWFATGFGSETAKGYGGTAATDVQALLNTIGSNTAFDRLQRMRAESPTGGALGAVSEIELQLLRDSIASLDQSQSDEQFRSNMDKVVESYQRVLDRLEGREEQPTPPAGTGGEIPGGEGLTGSVSDDTPSPYDPGGPFDPVRAERMGGGGFMTALGQGAGSVVQGAGDILGIATNPVGQLLYDALGYDQQYDTGQILREATGLPENPNRTNDAIIRGATAAMSGAGAARAASTITSPGVAQNALNLIGRTPIRDTAAGAGAGAGMVAGGESGIPGGEVAGALVGGLAGYGGANALARTAAPRSPPPPNALASRATPPGVDEVRDLTAQTGVPVMTSDVRPPTTFMGKAGRAAGERIPWAGTGGVRAKQQVARKEAVTDVLEEFGGLSDAPALDKVMADLSAQRGQALSKFTQTKKDIAGQLSDAGPVPVPNAVAAIDRQIAALQGLKTKNVQPVVGVLEDWKQALQGQGIDNIETLRKQVGQSFAAPELAAVRDTGEKALSAVYGPLRDDIGAFVGTQLGEGAARQWTLANRNLSRMAGDLKMGSLRRVLLKGDSTPEDVGRLLFSSKPSEVRALYSGLSDKGKANARAAVMQRVFHKLGDEVDTISPDRFLNVIKQVSEPIGVFFRGADALRVQGLVKALQITRRAGEANVQTPTGQQAVPFVAGSLLTDIFGTMGGATGGAASIGVAARVYESRAVRNALIRLGRAKAGSEQEAKALDGLKGALAAFTAQNSNVVKLPVREALSQSPGRLAAAEQEDN